MRGKVAGLSESGEPAVNAGIDPSATRRTAKRKPQAPDSESPATFDDSPPCLLPTTDEVNTLTRKQQDEYLTLLTKGASAAAACQKLGISITALLVTMEQSPKFRTRATAVSDVLSQNVAAQLYQTAMKGSVTAQTFYLRNQPPPEWPTEEDEPPPPPDLAHLTTAELETLDAAEEEELKAIKGKRKPAK